MALLIDGYNLLHATDIFGTAGSTETALHASRQALLNTLASALDDKTRAETTIVFDAAGAPPGLPHTLSHLGMTVHFARRYANADEMLEQLIEEHLSPRMLTVVSSDHRVQRAARRRSASCVDSDRWYAELRAAHRQRSTHDEPSAKPAEALTPEQVAYWLGQFEDPERPMRKKKRGPKE
jgi:predicted RNA-binding protein with PIN domain